MTESLLDGNTDPVIDENIDHLAELTKPGAKFDRTKYASEQDMHKAIAKGKYEADVYIPHKNRLYDELRDDYLKLKDDYNAGPKLQELVDQLANKQLTSSNANLKANEVTDVKPTLDPKEMETLISSQIQKHEQQRKEQDNYNSVKAKLTERFGSNYKNVIKEQVQDLGLTDEDINILARKSPKAFFNTLGLDREESKDSFQSPPRSNQRNDNFAPNTQKRTWAYYQKMRKESPELYTQPKTQLQLMKDASELGKDFEDGDFDVR